MQLVVVVVKTIGPLRQVLNQSKVVVVAQLCGYGIPSLFNLKA